jgi:hypothetical protein
MLQISWRQEIKRFVAGDQIFTFRFWPFVGFIIGIETFCVAGVGLAMAIIPPSHPWSHPILVYGLGTMTGLILTIYTFGKARKIIKD